MNSLFKNPIITKTASLAVLAAVRTMHLTYRYRYHGVEHVHTAKTTSDGFIYSCWHRNVIASTLSQSKGQYVVMVSRSATADPIATVCESFGHIVVRGSSAKRRKNRTKDKGGAAAKAEMVEVLKSGINGAVTADGPTGPAQKAKPGIIDMARQTGYAIIPFAGIPNRAWELDTWDKMLIPKPFARIDVYYGEPLQVTKDRHSEHDEALLTRLNAATEQLESLAKSEPNTVP